MRSLLRVAVIGVLLSVAVAACSGAVTGPVPQTMAPRGNGGSGGGMGM